MDLRDEYPCLVEICKLYLEVLAHLENNGSLAGLVGVSDLRLVIAPRAPSKDHVSHFIYTCDETFVEAKIRMLNYVKDRIASQVKQATGVSVPNLPSYEGKERIKTYIDNVVGQVRDALYS